MMEKRDDFNFCWHEKEDENYDITRKEQFFFTWQKVKKNFYSRKKTEVKKSSRKKGFDLMQCQRVHR